MRDDIAEARHVIAEHQQVVRKLEKDLEMREARIEELEKVRFATWSIVLVGFVFVRAIVEMHLFKSVQCTGFLLSTNQKFW